jgi:hypothetical protein
MRTLLRVIGYGFIALAGLAAAVSIFARFADGPIGPFPGGRMKGTIESGNPDPSAFAGDSTIELQVNSADPRSLHVWFVVEDGVLYVPSAWAPKKKWPAQVEADPHVVMRVGGHLYGRNATRVADPALVGRLIEAVQQKYHAGRGDPETTWFFRLDPPR